MPAIRAPTLLHGIRSSHCSFLPSFDERPLPPRSFPSVSGDLYSDFTPHQFNGASRSQSTGVLSSILTDRISDSHLSGMYQTGPLSLSDLEAYDPAVNCPPPFLTPSNEDMYSFSRTSDNQQQFAFSYDSASSSSSSPFMSPEHSLPLHLMSPSISITSDSPRSEPGALSPPLQDFSGSMFDFDYGASAYTGEYSSSSWSSSHLSASTHTKPSSSPCPSNTDLSDMASSISRDASPLRGENEKPDRRRFPCHIIGCERKFTSQYTLKVHMEAHKPKPRVSFPCTEGCSERFSRQHDRLRHEVAKHGKVCEFLCDDCGRFFSTKKTLGNHKCPVAQGGTRWVAS